jgi:amino acid transporter
MITRVKTFLIGRPLANEQAEQEKLNVPLGLAVFSADALSSTAYATDEILLALTASAYAAQAGALSLPVALAIVLLIALVVISYRQVIRAYPDGGGAYIVARANLGRTPSHVAAAALLIDYILTVAVSISAGIAAIVATGLLDPDSATQACLMCTLIIMVVNLRGVRESGMAFALPAYTFLAAMFILIVVGVGRVLQHPPGQTLPLAPDLSMGYCLLFLKAFSHGCAGLTGIEAVSNGVKAFQEPAPRRANQTMTLMGCLLSFIFLGITYLAYANGIGPVRNETILSQVAAAAFGKGSAAYYLVQFSTMVMLVLAANTAFADFPRVANLLADDGYLPRQLKNIGDRLVFNNGILILGLLAGGLIQLYHGDTTSLIPLYAVGVFISFTLSQLGMVRHHLRERQNGWRHGCVINAFGASVTAMVTVLLAVEKFKEGAWIVLVAIPALILLFRRVKAHYVSVGQQLALDNQFHFPIPHQHRVLVLVSAMGKGTVPAIAYARSVSPAAEAVHVEINPEATRRLQDNWERWGEGMPLVILSSPFRSLTEPLLAYLDQVEASLEPGSWVTVVIPEFVTKKLWHNALHNQSALLLGTLLRFRKGTIVTTVRFYLDE